LAEAGNEPERRKVWAEMLLDALGEKGAALNHAGEPAAQAAILEEHARTMDKEIGLLGLDHGSYFRKRLELRNRLVNRLFNDYCFMEVIEDIEPEAASLATQVEQARNRHAKNGNPAMYQDILLGKLQGTVGQACGFLAATEPSWAEHGEHWLKQSEAQFPPGSRYHSMTVNYRTTLAWQRGDLTGALAIFAMLPELGKAGDPEEFRCRWPEMVAGLKARPFDAMNLLRLAALATEKGHQLETSALQIVDAALTAGPADAHPHEQIAKWLAYLWLLAGNPERAIQLCEQGRGICDRAAFAMQSIGLGILALEIAARRIQGSACEAQLRLWDRSAAELAAHGPAFAQFLEQRGGIELIRSWTMGEIGSLREIVRINPFTYA
jgi:hypothetical protein